MGIQMGTNHRHLGQDQMKIGMSAFSDGLDEAREGKRGVVTDSGSNLNTPVNNNGKSAASMGSREKGWWARSKDMFGHFSEEMRIRRYGSKCPPANAGDLGSIPGLGRFPGEGNSNPLQFSWLGNPMDRGAWWATICGVAKELGTT